ATRGPDAAWITAFTSASGRPGEAPAYAGTDFIIVRDGRDDTLDAEPGVLPSRIAHLGRRGARRSAARSGGRALRPDGHLIASGLIELGAVWARPAFDGVVFPIVFILPAFPSSEKERE